MAMAIVNQEKSIAEFFENKSVFLTGGSGFIGRVLIEKILRTFPGLKNVYVLIRPKKNVSVEKRIEALVNVRLFDKLREENGEALKKIVGVVGDITQNNLGLNDEDTKTIIDNVSIIYHIAASVRFDDALHIAIITNIRSTRDIISLAKQCKTLDVYVHCSTAYSNYHEDLIEEKVYTPGMDWRTAIELSENYDPVALQTLTDKVIKPLPNTYTFTKGLAEQAVVDLCTNQIPAVIMRPSIVLPTHSDPFGGWIDNLNGPMIIDLMAGTGLVKSLYVDIDLPHDHVYVDTTVKAFIIATAKNSHYPDTSSVDVYNITSDVNYSPRFDRNEGLRAVKRNPPESYLWLGNVSITNNFYLFYLSTLIYHVLPAILLDGISLLLRKKTRFIKLYQKLYRASIFLLPFTTKKHEFKSDNYLALEDYLIESDKKSLSFIGFRLAFNSEGTKKVIDVMWMGLKEHLLKEKAHSTPAEIKRYNRTFKIHRYISYAVHSWIFYLLISTFIFPVITSQINKILET